MVFYWAYREWLGWFLLVGMLCLPGLSLAVSLPAIITCRLVLRCPHSVSMGTQVPAALEARSPFPMPALRGKLRLTDLLTGETHQIRLGKPLPTGHCGSLEISPKKTHVCDYLGLLAFPTRKPQTQVLRVMPTPVPMETPPDMSRYISFASRPKPGGGFSENHELRLYRPGDSLRQIHWKLSAKTGKLILREPMETLRGQALLTLELTGSREELDWKLGRLLWLSRYLLEKEVPHRIHCLTGKGMLQFSVATQEHLLRALEALLQSGQASPDSQPQYLSAAWRYHIGGDAHDQ